jgi:hypothetical protein
MLIRAVTVLSVQSDSEREARSSAGCRTAVSSHSENAIRIKMDHIAC